MFEFLRIERPTNATLRPHVDADVDRLLHAVDVRRERRDEDAARAQREDLAERLADDALGLRDARAARRSSSRRAGGRRRGCRARRACRRRSSGRRPACGRACSRPCARSGRPASRGRGRRRRGSSAPCARTRCGTARGRTARRRRSASRSSAARSSPCSSSFDLTSPSVSRVAHDLAAPSPRAGDTAASRRGPRAPCVSTTARIIASRSRRYVKSGSTRSTPRCSSRGNASPASTNDRCRPPRRRSCSSRPRRGRRAG